MAPKTVAGLALALTALAACGHGSKSRMADSDEPRMAAPSPQPGIEGVMQIKLAHAQALVAGIARADFPGIRRNALDLEAISRQSEFLVHDTVTYGLFSQQFQQVSRAMADDAGRHNLDDVTADYVEMIHTCVACHTYLRQERLIRDFPAKVSMLKPMDLP